MLILSFSLGIPAWLFVRFRSLINQIRIADILEVSKKKRCNRYLLLTSLFPFGMKSTFFIF